jgi:rubrerythrin
MPRPKAVPVQAEEKDELLAVGATLAIAENATNGRSAADPDELAPQPRLPRFRCDRCGYGACCRMAPERCPMCGGSIWSFETRFRSGSEFPRRRDPSL